MEEPVYAKPIKLFYKDGSGARHSRFDASSCSNMRRCAFRFILGVPSRSSLQGGWRHGERGCAARTSENWGSLEGLGSAALLPLLAAALPIHAAAIFRQRRPSPRDRYGILILHRRTTDRGIRLV